MAATGLVLDPLFEKHVTAMGHPERPARLQAIGRAIREAGLADRCRTLGIEPIRLEELYHIHEQPYVERVRQACADGAPIIDVADSSICPASYEIALQAAGAVLGAVDEVMSGALRNAFCAVRPPGHHAEFNRSMGFCLFNNVALAADRLLRKHHLKRVMIVDWDVHHCNGTQNTFEKSPDVFVCSLHGHPAYVYPGTGYENEQGIGPGEGYTLNIPVMPGARGDVYRAAFQEKVLPAIERYQPEFLLISAGFDAHRLDPLAPIKLESDDFDWMTRWLMDAAARHCGSKIVSMLEGGYHLEALAESVQKHLRLLLDYDPNPAPGHESGAW